MVADCDDGLAPLGWVILGVFLLSIVGTTAFSLLAVFNPIPDILSTDILWLLATAAFSIFFLSIVTSFAVNHAIWELPDVSRAIFTKPCRRCGGNPTKGDEVCSNCGGRGIEHWRSISRKTPFDRNAKVRVAVDPDEIECVNAELKARRGV